MTTPRGRRELPRIEDNKNGTVSINYQPNERGLHTMDVAYNQQPIQGSPFKFFVDALTTGRVTAYGPGLSHGQVGQPAEFTIVTKDAGPGMCKRVLFTVLFMGHNEVKMLRNFSNIMFRCCHNELNYLLGLGQCTYFCNYRRPVIGCRRSLKSGNSMC